MSSVNQRLAISARLHEIERKQINFNLTYILVVDQLHLVGHVISCICA